MLEESVPSIWASIHGWFTPAVLFVVLNLVIGTIAVTSNLLRHPDADHPVAEPIRKLARSPSLVLDRLRSFNLNLHRHNAPDPSIDSLVVPSPPADPSRIETLESVALPSDLVEDDPMESLPDPLEGASAKVPPDLVEEALLESQEHHFGRSRSNALPTAGEMPEKLARRLKKSASDKSAIAHFTQKEIAPQLTPPQPETEMAVKEAEEDDEEEEDNGAVDARADDFINRFRQQLKLQRLDSFMRYEEMLSRGR